MVNTYIDKINNFFFNYGGYVSLILYITLAYVWFSYDPLKIMSNYQFIAIPITLLLGLIIILVSDFNSKKVFLFGKEASTPSLSEWLKKVFGSIGLYGLVLFSIFAIFWIFANFGRFISYLIYASYALSIIGALAIVYKLLTPLLNDISAPKFIQLLKNVIFYIPCLLINLFDNIAGTKKSIWLILLFEVVVILLYFVLPILMKNKYLRMGTVLVGEPQYLNHISHINIETNQSVIEKSKDTLHYAITADIWIDPQPTSTSIAYTQDTNLLSFGDRVRIMYNGTKPKNIIVKAKNGHNEEKVTSVPIKLQYWNNIVINYDHGTLDIFINKELVYSGQNVPYIQVAGIEGGAEDGIHGGIKNIRFFDKPLTSNQISLVTFSP